MHADDSVRTRRAGKTDPLDSRQQAILILQRTLMSFRGHAPFAYLGEIHRLAVEQHGFEGSLEQAAELVSEIPEVRIDVARGLSQSHVYASAYWSPTSRST